MFLLLVALAIAGQVSAEGCCELGRIEHPRKKLTVAEAFVEYGIVGDYIPEPPKDLFNAGFDTVEIKPGIVMSPLRTLGEPHLSYPNAVEGKLYSVILLDIDRPSRANPSNRAYIHGLFMNAPADELKKGDMIVPYVPAVPGLGTGYHRFIGLVYTQQGYINPNITSLTSLARKRLDFSAVQFAEEFDLEGPAAGTFFLAEFSICGHSDKHYH